MSFVKICGVTDPVTARIVYKAGADAVGFVFADSRREVSPQEAAGIAESLPDDILKVAVFRHATQREVDRVLESFAADLVQADHTSRVLLPPRVGWLPVYRNPEPDVTDAQLLFEGELSGVGRTADWDKAERLARTKKLVLAGGLNPENVGAAVQAVRPFGVDVSSGVECPRGRKEPDLIRRFVHAARQAMQAMSRKADR